MTTICPVLAFTPAVERVLRWFDCTHDLVEGRWRRTGLPGPGSLGDQEAWLLEALELVRAVQNSLIVARTTHTTGDRVRPIDEGRVDG